MGAGADAEDAAQEALLRAWLHRSACRERGAPLPWMAQIARNEALRTFERSRHRLETLAEDPVPASAGDEHQLDALGGRLDVHRALAELAPGDRNLLHLRYELDLTQPAIAELLSVPEGTVKVRLHRLRKRLSDVLEPANEA
jgi:RNA polymerase sigma-70 factor (ECF subfamily)